MLLIVAQSGHDATFVEMFGGEPFSDKAISQPESI